MRSKEKTNNCSKKSGTSLLVIRSWLRKWNIVYTCGCDSLWITYPSEDPQMLSSLLKSRLGSRSCGNSSSSSSSWSPAAPLLSSTPVMTGTSGNPGWGGRLCRLAVASVSSGLSSLWVKLSVWASACGAVKHNCSDQHYMPQSRLLYAW